MLCLKHLPCLANPPFIDLCTAFVMPFSEVLRPFVIPPWRTICLRGGGGGGGVTERATKRDRRREGEEKGGGGKREEERRRRAGENEKEISTKLWSSRSVFLQTSKKDQGLSLIHI